MTTRLLNLFLMGLLNFYTVSSYRQCAYLSYLSSLSHEDRIRFEITNTDTDGILKCVQH